ncbi:unnamed protein product [Ambrosiozyma monospora]|uniref:Unnamed protein product n=1 Tax=Ambrosiozyma monospora TaxID=43982 RepID=A0A9W6YXP8_AMBMO|nr:unnamed protein product [Ambrosiozyma monospora]
MFCFFPKLHDFGPHNSIHPAILVAVILGCAWYMLCLNLIVSCLHAMWLNDTLLDQMRMAKSARMNRRLNSLQTGRGIGLLSCCLGEARRKRFGSVESLQNSVESCEVYLSVLHPELKNVRVILLVDTKKHHPFNHGFFNNFLDWLKKPKFDNIEQVIYFENAMVSETYRRQLYERIYKGEGVVFGSKEVTPVLI